ncbi:MAG: DUF374 domain-containing protein [Pirellulales bacterium]
MRPPWKHESVRHFLAGVGALGIAIYMLLLRWTCRIRLHHDPRPDLRAAGSSYVYSVLHAQQLAAATCGDRGTAAMVSQSQDGTLVAIGLKWVGIIPIRGSSQRRKGDKGGLTALQNLIDHVRSGQPAYLAVDGPRGPRNRVHKGIAALSKQSAAPVLNAVVVPSRRWIIKGSWDRLQVPALFCRIEVYFDVLHPIAAESIEDYRRRIETSLNSLEVKHDPTEAAIAANPAITAAARESAAA